MSYEADPAMKATYTLRRAVAETAVITPSGALSPGPLSASAIAAGAGLGVLGGVLVALGHLLVELPYFALLVRIMGGLEERLGRWSRLLDLVSGVFILFFAYLLAASGLEALRGGAGGLPGGGAVGSPVLALVAGIVLTGGNAYFLAWWLSAGRPIVEGARALGWPRSCLVYGVHFSYDISWLALLAYIGGLAVRPRVLGFVFLVLAGVLFYYGVRMILRLAGRVQG